MKKINRLTNKYFNIESVTYTIAIVQTVLIAWFVALLMFVTLETCGKYMISLMLTLLQLEH